jgi:hypothetical protein
MDEIHKMISKQLADVNSALLLHPKGNAKELEQIKLLSERYKEDVS